jgi:hypothetical protein
MNSVDLMMHGGKRALHRDSYLKKHVSVSAVREFSLYLSWQTDLLND